MVRKMAGTWTAYFTIGRQSFDLLPIYNEEQNEQSAKWQAEMLRSAFDIPRIGDVPEQHMNGATYIAITGRSCTHANGWYHTVRFWRWERRYFACHDCAELVPIAGWVFKW